MLESLKKRWGVSSNLQLWLIIFVFSVAGSASLHVRIFIFKQLGLNPDISLWFKIPLFIINYQILLIIIGSICGQFKFFWNFQKKSWGRFIPKKKKAYI